MEQAVVLRVQVRLQKIWGLGISQQGTQPLIRTQKVEGGVLCLLPAAHTERAAVFSEGLLGSLFP